MNGKITIVNGNTKVVITKDSVLLVADKIQLN